MGVVTTEPDELGVLLQHHYARLVRTGYLLTGDRGAAADLAQDTCVRALTKRRAVLRADHPQAYLRQVLINEFLSKRRQRRLQEVLMADLPEHGYSTDAATDRDELRRLLVSLPARQRAAVVLRHYEDMSEAGVAELLGCSIGNVKSLTSRGLAALRLEATTTRSQA